MKRLVTSLILAVVTSVQVFAAAYDLRIQRRNSSNTLVNVDLTVPTGENAILGYNGTSLMPEMFKFSTEIYWDSADNKIKLDPTFKAFLLNRSNHTGHQDFSTILGIGMVSETNAGIMGAPDKQKLNALKVTAINSNVSRSLDTEFTIDGERAARVKYTIKFEWLTTVGDATSSEVFLEYSTDTGSSWITVSEEAFIKDAGLVDSGEVREILSGEIPANGLVRIRTASTNSTITYVRGQEVY